jgi:pyrroline-5-carboxylate reductase
MPVVRDIEKFPTLELQELRDGLLQQGLDSWQAADLISSFLAGRGYGVSRQSARDALLRADVISHSIDGIQAELERIAMVM